MKTLTNSLARTINAEKPLSKMKWEDMPRGNCETCNLVFVNFDNGFKQCNTCLKPIY